MRIGRHEAAEPHSFVAAELFEHDDVRLGSFEKTADRGVVVVAEPRIERDDAKLRRACRLRRRYAHVADDGNRTEHGAGDGGRAEQWRTQRKQQDREDQQQ